MIERSSELIVIFELKNTISSDLLHRSLQLKKKEKIKDWTMCSERNQ
jgi:hypothetical protein